MKFSILHTTARREGWYGAYRAWLNSAVHPEDVEYVLCVDERWGFPSDYLINCEGIRTRLRPQDKLVWNTGRKCMVDGYKCAAEVSTGDILILNSDDMRPCSAWDEELWSASWAKLGVSEDFVIQVSSGTPADSRNLMVLQILSRGRYERLGYVLYPKYESMYADDDFSEHASHDGVVIDAREYVFPHLHGKIEGDPVYEHQNRRQAYEEGRRLLELRRASGFQNVELPAIPESKTNGKVIGLCLPGEEFNRWMLYAFFELWGQCFVHGYGVTVFQNACSDIRIGRTLLNVDALNFEPALEYIVWIDHDNPVKWEQLEMLIEDLEVLPENSMVVGWCLIQADMIDGFEQHPPRSSVAMIPEGQWESIPVPELENASGLMEVEASGFPFVVMKRSTAELAGKFPFQPYVGEKYTFGQTGEDVSFCMRLREKGGHVFVDPRVQVPHLKIRPVMPIYSASTTMPTKISEVPVNENSKEKEESWQQV